MEITFGQALGALIREKRGQENLTQRELAIRAFDDESKVRRIIDIENGAVRRPHVKTIDPLVACLGITREELAACQNRSIFTLEEAGSIGLSRQLLENLAGRFDHDNPDALDADLLRFLQNKALELRGVRERLAQLDASSTSLKNQVAAASQALETGDFDQADEILAGAEELHEQERTLAAIETQVGIRSTRGDAALFKGDVPLAASHYLRAAEFVLGFDKARVAELLVDYSGRIYELARRSMDPRFEEAVFLLDKAAAYVNGADRSAIWVEVNYCAALVKQTEAQRQQPEGAQLLDSAIEQCSAALTASNGTDREFDVARCEFLLANCYMARAQLGGNELWLQDIQTAIAGYERYLARALTPVFAVHRPAIFNSLATAYQTLAEGDQKYETVELRRKRKGYFLRAIELSADAGEPDIWGAAQHNLAGELYEEVKRSGSSGGQFLTMQAIAACLASLEVFPTTGFSVQAASTHLLLAKLLMVAGSSYPTEVGAVYFDRAQRSLLTCELVFSETSKRNNLAETHYCFALLCIFHAETFAESAREDLAEAHRRLDAALAAGQSPSETFEAKCLALRERASHVLVEMDVTRFRKQGARHSGQYP